jgi:hypothetical protein
MAILKETVQRISCGRVIMPPQMCDKHAAEEKGWYILGIGRAPKASATFAPVGQPLAEGALGDRGYYEVTSADPKLRRYTLPIQQGSFAGREEELRAENPELHTFLSDESPYTDREEAVLKLTNEISRGTNTTRDVIDRLIDILRPFQTMEMERVEPRLHTSENYLFGYAPDEGIIPDDMMSAGMILTEEKRRIYDPDFKMERIVFTSIMDSFMLAVAVLRKLGLNAYPALAVIPDRDPDKHPSEQQTIYSPIVALVELSKDVPLKTFALARNHPGMASVDILSDVAMKAVTWAMLAELRIKHLTIEMAKQSKEGRMLPEEEVGNQIKRIGDALFECHVRWPGSYMINDTIAYFAKDVMEAIIAIELDGIQANMEEIAKNNPMMMMPGMIDQHVTKAGFEVAQNYQTHLFDYFSARIAGLEIVPSDQLDKK